MEDKLEKYFNYVVDDLIKGTEHWSNPYYREQIERDHIGVIFPMYYEDDIEFYYTVDEVKDWLHTGWKVGSDDIEYLMSNYGLTEDECEKVMEVYGIKLATLLISEYGKK